MTKKKAKIVAKKKVAKKTVRKVKRAKTAKKEISSKSAPKARISNFSFESVAHPKFDELVIITKAPKWAKQTIGKRYLNADYAKKMIAELVAEHCINKDEVSVNSQVTNTLGEEVIQTEVETVTTSDYDTE